MRTLLIDDLRNLKADVIARNPTEGILLLENCGPWDLLLLDHDMATYDEKGKEITGYDVLLWIEERAYCIINNPTLTRKRKLELLEKKIPKQIELVTDNASAREKMLLARKSITSQIDDFERQN